MKHNKPIHDLLNCKIRSIDQLNFKFNIKQAFLQNFFLKENTL